jgi:peroxiredoxin (alkyl hydroperoxide reductase subunit C)
MLMANVAVGQEAPDFKLRDENNQEVTLSSLRGTPVVLVFYPLDFSPICTNELCAIRDDYSAFEAKDAKVFGISRDSTWAHKAFKEKEQLTMSLLADMNGNVAKLYGAWNDQIGIAERLTVVIDRDGVTRYVVHNSVAQARDHKEALAALG